MRRGVPCNENRFSSLRISTQGKPCSGPVRDCSALNHVSFNVMNDRPNQVLKPAGAPEVGIAKNR